MNIIEQNKSTVYGPVKSWRFGMSVGIDLLFQTSICSFNCVYCQLGNIQQHTSQRDIYVPTEQFIQDFDEFIASNQDFDVITFSGNGEPTLASNISEVIDYIKSKTNKQLQILTNGTMLGKTEVQQALSKIDRVTIKLDSPNQEVLNKVNRIVDEISFDELIAGIKSFKKQYTGILDIQMMFMPLNYKYKQDYINILKEIQPDSVQLNTPKREYPLSSHRENRGNHDGIFSYKTRKLAVISPKEAQTLEQELKQATGLEFISVYR